MEDIDFRTNAEASEFCNKYEPKEVLGRGLSSVVRKCVHRETGQEYAVKVIDMMADEAVQYSVAAEIDVFRELPPHKHIIYLQDHFESPTFHFLVFELARGGELFDYLTKMVKLSEKKSRHIMHQLFLAVCHMHRHNVVHRDLKPENILMDENLDLKVSDFGFSVKLNDGETLTELMGTPGYLAPEMLKVSVEDDAAGYGKEIDLWACGVIMYTLLVGFPPFWHRKQLVMLRAIMDGRYQFASPEWEEVSDEAKDLIRKLLVVDPSKRLTAEEAMSHPWLCFVKPVQERISPKRRLRGYLTALWFLCRLRKLHRESTFVSMQTLSPSPYENRYVRKLVDACAFRMYGHWVKRGEQQNRAALFEINPHSLSGISVGPSVMNKLFHQEPVSWDNFS